VGWPRGSPPDIGQQHPTTCGVAIDVPLPTLVAMSLVDQADLIPTPGAANISRQVPKFESYALASFFRVEPTVIASETRAGDQPQASSATCVSPFWPAATPYVIPEAIESRSA